MAKSGATTMIRDVLDHVVPEELAVVHAHEAEDRHARGDECADEGHRPSDRPRVTRVQGVVATHPPEVEGQRHQDHRHRHEVELAGSEFGASQRRERCSERAAITAWKVLLRCVESQSARRCDDRQRGSCCRREAMAPLGELERRVMDVLWGSMGAPLTGRQVADQLPDRAYTTVLTISSVCAARTWWSGPPRERRIVRGVRQPGDLHGRADGRGAGERPGPTGGPRAVRRGGQP